MEAYFDNSATTRCYPEVAEIVVKTMTEDFGNPSAMHLKGVEAEKYVREAAQILAKILKVNEKEIIFTSGGTESNNLALFGGADANKRSGNHIITTSVEHAAVGQPAERLEQMGYEVTIVPVDHRGVVQLEALEKALRPDTILVSVMYVNNEIGAIEPIAELGKVIKDFNPEIIFHVDAVQAFGKVKIAPYREKIDLLSISSHKIHGPKGVGVLFIKDKTKIRPIVFGGGQQKNMRSGTENVPGIAGMALSAEMIYSKFDEDINKMYELKEYFINEVTKIEGTTVNGLTGRESAPHVISVSFEDIPRSEVLLHALEEKGIYVSSGSACASNHPALSGTLQAIGVRKDLLSSTLRFSLSVFTTKEELDYTISALKILLPVLRKYKPR